MSVCVGARDSSGVYFASDSLETSNNLKLPGTHRKIRECNGIAFMTAGISSASAIMIEALEQIGDKQFVRLRDLRYGLMALFERHGWMARGEEGAPKRYQVSYLLSDGRRLAEITNGGEPAFVSGDFAAHGSGWLEAYAADASMRVLRPRARAKARVEHAVRIASQLDNYCGGDVQVLHVSRRRHRVLV